MSGRALEVVHESAPGRDPEALENDLPWLHAQVLALGRPSYFCDDRGGWQASVHVPTDRPGFMAEVKGDFNCPTLSAAIENLLAKVRG